MCMSSISLAEIITPPHDSKGPVISVYGRAGTRRLPEFRQSLSFVPCASLDDDVHALQQVDVTQHIAAHGNDVGVLAGAEGADVTLLPHRHRRPVGCRP